MARHGMLRSIQCDDFTDTICTALLEPSRYRMQYVLRTTLHSTGYTSGWVTTTSTTTHL